MQRSIWYAALTRGIFGVCSLARWASRRTIPAYGVMLPLSAGTGVRPRNQHRPTSGNHTLGKNSPDHRREAADSIVTSCLDALTALVRAADGSDENTETIVVGTYGDWTMMALLDTFDEKEIAWYASVRAGSAGEVRLEHLEGGTYRFSAFTSNPLAPSLGSILHSAIPVRVQVKVKGKPILKVNGAYPNTLVQEDDFTTVGRYLLGAKEAKIQTWHRDQKHAFTFSLEGFEEAGLWLLDGDGRRDGSGPGPIVVGAG